MLATTLLSALATFGTSALAAPVDGISLSNSEYANAAPDFESADNSTLVRRVSTTPSASSGLSYSVTMEDGTLVGTIPDNDKQVPKDNPFLDCKVVKWGKSHDRYGIGKANDAKVQCYSWSKQVVWDIRRIGDVTYCDRGNQHDTWKVEDSETTSVGMELGISAAFKIFDASLGFSVSNEVTKTTSHEKSVECGDFKGVKCLMGGHAIAELGYIEGWVSIPQNDPINTWQMQTKEEPYGMRDFRKVTDRAWNKKYETGWYDWQAEGEQECRFDINDRHYAARQI